MNDALSQLDDAARQSIQETKLPGFVQPMKAVLSHEAFSDPDWIYERKLDGERCLIRKEGKQIELYSRNEKQKNAVYPEITEGAEQMDGDFLLDSEIVTFKGRTTSFKRLQKRMHDTSPDTSLLDAVPVFAYVFDILFLDGYDLRDLPLRQRKRVLRKAFNWEDPIRFLPHRNEQGKSFLKKACGKGWEGLIAKDAGSGYTSSRSRNWLKLKCGHRQEVVIGGFTEPEGERKGFGALLVGYYDSGDAFVYAGKIGTGFDDEFLQSFHQKLERIERKTSPFKDFDQGDSVHWVRPKYVAEVGFTEWTGNNRLRHPRFLGLRDDKAPEEVRKESSS